MTRREKGSTRGVKARGGNPLLNIKHNLRETDSNMGSDDESIPDNASIISLASTKLDMDLDSDPREEGETGDDGFYDDFEDKILDAINNATDKSVKSRVLALEFISRAFRSRFMYDFIIDRRMTVMDIIEKSVKKGKGEEQGVAAILSSVIATSLGPSDETDGMFKEFCDLLKIVIADTTASPVARAKCSSALGLNLFINCDVRICDSEVFKTAMDVLATNFCGSCLKGNGQVKSDLSPAVTTMHASGLMAWALLLSNQSTETVLSLADQYGRKISQLLESPDVDLRIAAGETIALMYEICRESDEDFELENHYSLVDKLKQLSTDHQKFRAKKDLKIQKSSFRDILKAVEEGSVPSTIVKFGRERIVINSWCLKRMYDSFCSILGSGINTHLTENGLLRDMFSLGAVAAVTTNGSTKASKFERHMENMAASKARTKVRGKQRDKRADVIE